MIDMEIPAPGDKAPDFALPASGGGALIGSDTLLGTPVVLFFYPKDDTPGCTKEAMAFSVLAEEFAKAGIQVFGVSKDPLNRHEKFIAKHGLSVTLLSDAETDVAERFGVWVEKALYGRRFMGIERTTFLINASGVILQAWRKVKVPGHAGEVLAAAKALT